MFYIYNTITGRYVVNPHASALRGSDVPQGFSVREFAQREIDRRDWVDEGTYAIHAVVCEENIVVDAS